MNYFIYLASQSYSRHKLLTDAQMPFATVAQHADEEAVSRDDDPKRYVCAIAEAKMASVGWRGAAQQHQDTSQTLFFVTTDTLICTSRDSKLLGKPRDRAHAVQMLRAMQDQEIDVLSGTCIKVVRFQDGEWCEIANEQLISVSHIAYHVPDDMIDAYLDRTPVAMSACGAAVVEGSGIQFFKTINGSFSATMGLDVWALAEEIRKHS